MHAQVVSTPMFLLLSSPKLVSSPVLLLAGARRSNSFQLLALHKSFLLFVFVRHLSTYYLFSWFICLTIVCRGGILLHLGFFFSLFIIAMITNEKVSIVVILLHDVKVMTGSHWKQFLTHTCKKRKKRRNNRINTGISWILCGLLARISFVNSLISSENTTGEYYSLNPGFKPLRHPK